MSELMTSQPVRPSDVPPTVNDGTNTTWFTHHMTDNFSNQQECFVFHAPRVKTFDPALSYCNATFDSFLCWPPMPVGETAETSCPIMSVTNTDQNATKLCRANGTWAIANYVHCVKDSNTEYYDDMGVRDVFAARVIYSVGFTITIIALVIALSIFIYFKSLRCLRNTIHCHLIVAFIFNSVVYVTLHSTLGSLYGYANQTKSFWICRLIMCLYNYFHSVTFYWMFVEGLYLYTIVVWAFSLQRIRLWHFALIGWGLPAIFPMIWAVVKSKVHEQGCWLPIGDNHYDLIMEIPIMILLLCNIVFIVCIVWVLITKLKASNSLETRQSRKAVRAICVLVPLLGITFIFFLRFPSGDKHATKIFTIVNAVLQSLQGLSVAILYCFMNGEVQSVLRKRFTSFQDNRALTRFTKSSIFSSPHRSSCYAMPLQANGKSTHSMQRASNGSGHSRLSQTADHDTEAASMMENVL